MMEPPIERDGWSASGSVAARWTMLLGAVLVMLGCTRRVEPIDLHDQTIPAEARQLVADAEDSIAIARAKRDEARRELEQTREWRRDLLERDWPSSADSVLSKLRELADARVELAELQLERAEEQIELAEAKYRLITAKTAIRQDLAIYDLEPLRKRVEREGTDVDELEGAISDKRSELARVEDDWWAKYAQWVEQGGDSRNFYVSIADLRTAESKEEASESSGEGDSSSEDSDGGGAEDS